MSTTIKYTVYDIWIYIYHFIRYIKYGLYSSLMIILHWTNIFVYTYIFPLIWSTFKVDNGCRSVAAILWKDLHSKPFLSVTINDGVYGGHSKAGLYIISGTRLLYTRQTYKEHNLLTRSILISLLLAFQLSASYTCYIVLKANHLSTIPPRISSIFKFVVACKTSIDSLSQIKI